MSPKHLLSLTILTFLSSISALTVLSKNLAPTNITAIPNITRSGHNQHRYQSDAFSSYPAEEQPLDPVIPTNPHPPNSNKSHIFPSRIHHQSTPRETNEAYPAPDHPETPSALLFDNPTTIDYANPTQTAGRKWFEAEWVNVVTWAMWLYVLGSVLGLLALWGKGLIDRRGEWVGGASEARGGGEGGGGEGERGNGSGRENERRGGGRDEVGQWRRLTPGELERMGF